MEANRLDQDPVLKTGGGEQPLVSSSLTAFDNIDHDKLLNLIGNFPAREMIRAWLEAGYMEEGVFHDTEIGQPT